MVLCLESPLNNGELIPAFIVNGKRGARSPLHLIRNGPGRYEVRASEEKYTDITFLPRPRFYDGTTASGLPGHKLAVIVGPGHLRSVVNQRCYYQQIGKPCRFCAVHLAQKPADLGSGGPQALLQVRGSKVGHHLAQQPQPGPERRRVSRLALRVHIYACRQQRIDDFLIAAVHGLHQRRFPHLVAGIRRRAVFEQQPDRVEVSFAGGVEQGSPAKPDVRWVDDRAAAQEAAETQA